ncbi:histone H1 [Flavobacterium muglaense]|uniref:Histone H1 n=1 Tax=Flavobacterium muglaense TaxID=2764716 RepID=A0A923SHF2_9FLAO|nr:histone H1 [Flavobacterium muglaense]MBC5839162.1 histone H1 [Flavobacterium muglaense]MBC5845624.1 histone H1 [Flavobacterium muglaense]
MKDLIEKINAEFEVFKTESDSLVEKGVKAAGARARKSTLELEKLLKEFRKVSIEESKK